MLAGLLMGTWLEKLFDSLAANRATQLALINAGALRRSILVYVKTCSLTPASREHMPVALAMLRVEFYPPWFLRQCSSHSSRLVRQVAAECGYAATSLPCRRQSSAGVPSLLYYL